MKVLHIAQMVKGGPSSYLSEILPHQIIVLGRANVRVLVPADQRRYLDFLDDDVMPAVAVTSARSPLALLWFLISAIGIIRREKPDLVHLHSTFAGMLVRAWYIAVPWRRPKIVYCSHGWAFNMQIPEAQRRVYGWVERILARATDAIICISEFEYREAVRRKLPVALLLLIRNGINDQAPVLVNDTPPYDADVLNLLFIGRHDPQKGLDVLIDAMRLLQSRPVTLHVVGEAVVSSESATEDLPNVVYHGWQSRDMVDRFIAAADAVVMPSRWEGFGLVAIEAMRRGTPVCASAVDALPELVREGVSGFLFPPENAGALASLVEKLDRETLQALRGSTRRWFVENFTSENLNRDLMLTYRRVCRAQSRTMVTAASTTPVEG